MSNDLQKAAEVVQKYSIATNSTDDRLVVISEPAARLIAAEIRAIHPEHPSGIWRLINAVEQAVERGDCPFDIEDAFEDYDAARIAALAKEPS